MRIQGLQADNFMRLKAVDISLKESGPLVLITGRNGQGKSSILDAIASALGGASMAPVKPVRDGQGSARIRVDLGDLIAERTFTEDGKTRLTVRPRDGKAYPNPQAILDRIIGNLTFDPMDFAHQRPKEQAETLRALVGLDTSDLDLRRDNLYQERTLVNREIVRQKAVAAELIHYPDAPKAKSDAADVLNECQTARIVIASNNAIRKARSVADCDLSDLQMKAESLRKRLKQVDAEIVQRIVDLTNYDANIATLVDPDQEAIERRLAAISEDNRKVDANLRKAEALEIAEESAKVSRSLTLAIEATDAERAERIAACPFPVGGLGIEPGYVTWNGIPLSQASQSERLRVAIAVSVAQNPDLRIVRVKDTPMLDADSLRVIEEWADKNNAQILMELVAAPEDGIGIVIEDGQVTSGPAKSPDKPKK